MVMIDDGSLSPNQTPFLQRVFVRFHDFFLWSRVRQKWVITFLLIFFLLSLLSLLFWFSSVNYANSTAGVLFWPIFALLCIWIGTGLCYILQPKFSLYQQATETCGQIVQEVSDQSILLDEITHILYSTLAVEHFSIWRFYDEDNVLIRLRAEGTIASDDFAELPFDISMVIGTGTRLVSELPPSALREGLTTLDVQGVTLLVLGNELIGLMGFGLAQNGHGYSRDMLRWLNIMSGQLALVVKNACLVTDLEDTLAKLQLAYRRTIDAEEEERRYLAIELHDDILSRLSTMALVLRGSQRRLTTNAANVQNDLLTLENEVQYLNRRLRDITQGLHPTVLTDLGLIAALQAYLDSIGKQALPASAPRVVTLTAQGFGDHRLNDQKLETDLYYITRQAIDNALFHAHAEQVLIHLRWGQQSISITVQDTGCGLKGSPEELMGQDGHLGLLSMNERTLAWQGRLTFNSAPGQGTTVHVRVPTSQASPSPAHLQAFTYHLRKFKEEACL